MSDDVVGLVPRLCDCSVAPPSVAPGNNSRTPGNELSGESVCVGGSSSSGAGAGCWTGKADAKLAWKQDEVPDARKGLLAAAAGVVA